jgi:hypothetical protein
VKHFITLNYTGKTLIIKEKRQEKLNCEVLKHTLLQKFIAHFVILMNFVIL